MKNIFFFVLVLLALLGGFLLVLGGMRMMRGGSPRQVCEILVYEIETEPGIDYAGGLVDRVIDTIDRRINNGRRTAQVSDDGNGQIEIRVFGDDPGAARRIERLLDADGTFEFRILANRKDHRGLIARALSEDTIAIDDSWGNLVAWWVPISRGREEDFPNREIVKRIRTVGGKTITEILVVKDDYNVTGEYLTQVSSGTDHRGSLSIDLQFNRIGGQLFGMLTSDNLPDKKDGFIRQLGIILDGKLHSAPAIQATISRRAQITGDFTTEEVEDFTVILNAGAMPARIRLVEKKAPETP